MAIVALITISAFITLWVYFRNDPSGGDMGRFIGASFLAVAAGSVILLFAGIISIQVCSSRFVSAQLAVKDKETELTKAGYVGFWMDPPKRLTIR